MQKRSHVRTMILLAILGAWGVILRFFDFPILPAAPFLKIDFSDLVVLIGMLIHGPAGIVVVAFIRDTINYILQGGQAGFPIGAVMSFTASVVMFIPTHFILNSLKKVSWKLKAVLMSITLTVGLVVSMSIINYYIALPIYTTVLNFPIDDYFGYILTVVAPFNLIKGIFLSVGQILVIKIVPNLLRKRNTIYPGYNLLKTN
ncbi:ECF transporter S component [Aerococcaceae bacterium INB8]|uniref:Riboflavin transporter n=1 Tax=Ruoffia halotolerans TaxID=2748684 RepID=A0A839A6G9_9LACT|nr:ECF transporter S component [Ruoffia halotolerans]MBA5729358.1 ECF transporter S component [Ruoffia halotolerans]